MMTDSTSTSFPGSAVLEMMNNGVPGEKIIIGKPGSNTDASTGYMDPATISQCLQHAQSANNSLASWSECLFLVDRIELAYLFVSDGGLMVWQDPTGLGSFIQEARGTIFPLS
jgi:hypothetical protein